VVRIFKYVYRTSVLGRQINVSYFLDIVYSGLESSSAVYVTEIMSAFRRRLCSYER